jgi:hypothetical protein
MIEVSGNKAGNLDGIYSVRRITGAGWDIVAVVVEKGKAVMSVDLPFDVLELSGKLVVEKNRLMNRLNRA